MLAAITTSMREAVRARRFCATGPVEAPAIRSVDEPGMDHRRAHRFLAGLADRRKRQASVRLAFAEQMRSIFDGAGAGLAEHRLMTRHQPVADAPEAVKIGLLPCLV